MTRSSLFYFLYFLYLNSLLPHRADDEEEDDDDESGPIRIRNLEDLIRQLEHHSRKHTNASILGVEDIRFSETEADRQYKVEIPSGYVRRFVLRRLRLKIVYYYNRILRFKFECVETKS